MMSVLASLLPSVAHACPMCFNGNNQNQEAFLYGSLLLMFVPTTALGGLAYWAYRRIKAQEQTRDQPLPADISTAQPSVLHVVPRR
jgi:hypothetical protein